MPTAFFIFFIKTPFHVEARNGVIWQAHVLGDEEGCQGGGAVTVRAGEDNTNLVAK